MAKAVEIPVYLFTGFLEAGKDPLYPGNAGG